MAIKAAEKLTSEYVFDKGTIESIILVTQTIDYFLPTAVCVIQNKLRLPTSIGSGRNGRECSLITAEPILSVYIQKIKVNDIFGKCSSYINFKKQICRNKKIPFPNNWKWYLRLNCPNRRGARYQNWLNDLSFNESGNPKLSGYLFLEGAEILNYTLDYFPRLMEDSLYRNNIQQDEIDLFVFHLANKYIMELLRKKMKIDESEFYRFYETGGNTVPSITPIALKEAQNDRTLNGDLSVLLAAPGLGYS